MSSRPIILDTATKPIPARPGILAIRITNAILENKKDDLAEALNEYFWLKNNQEKLIGWRELKLAALMNLPDIARMLVQWGARPTGQDLKDLRADLDDMRMFECALRVLKKAGIREVDMLRTVVLTSRFVESKADYTNCFGVYVVDENKNISQTRMIFNDITKTTPHSTIKRVFTLFPNESLGAFIVSDGYRKNNANIFLSDRFNFVTSRTKSSFPELFAQNDQRVEGHCFHVWPELNKDGCNHVTRTSDEPFTLKLGFEDMWNNGDHSFTDVVIELSATSSPFIQDQTLERRTSPLPVAQMFF